MSATYTAMGSTREPLAVYADALRAGDRRLAELIARRLFPARPAAGADQPERDVPPAARRAIERLLRSLGQ